MGGIRIIVDSGCFVSLVGGLVGCIVDCIVSVEWKRAMEKESRKKGEDRPRTTI